MKKRMKLLSLLLCINLLITVLLPQGALAATGSALTLEYNCSGVTFHIYRIGDEKRKLTEAFSGYSVSLDCANNAEWLALATTLSGYASRDNITPDAEAETALDNRARFENLKSGWYLVMGESSAVSDKIQTPVPFILWLGQDDSVISQIKWDEKDKPMNQSWSCTVKKVWNDSGSSGRPDSVQIQLLKDNAVYETVTLNELNGWSYTWENLSMSGNWMVTEVQVPSNYTVAVAREGNTFTVTNSRSGGGNGDNGGSSGGGSSSGGHSSIITGGSVTIPEEQIPLTPVPAEEQTPSGKLPQTGQLWWPVPILTAGGALFLLVGLMSGKKRRQDDEG